MQNQIRVNMLGRFTIAYGDGPAKTVSLTGRSRRLWTLVAYLILHRSRGVPAQELIDLLWPEAESDNPMSTLQNNVSRARNALSELGIPNARELIRYAEGFYRWNPEADTVLDCDLFEEFIKDSAAAPSRAEAIDLSLRAIDLYEGDFLPEACLEHWCIHLNTYYRSAYVRLCQTTVDWLFEADRLADAERICKAAVVIDPTIEEFSVYLMRALTANGNPQKALEQYDYIKRLYKELYGVSISAQMEIEKAAALHMLYGHQMTERDIREFFNEDNAPNQAFYCDNNVFREIVNLRARDIRRSDGNAVLMVLILDVNGTTPQGQAIDVQRMEHVISVTLRAGDAFTKLSHSQFMILLAGAARENVSQIVARIRERYKREYPKSEPRFSVTVVDVRELKNLG